MFKQTSIQLSDITRQEMQALADLWGLPQTRHITPVVSRSIQIVKIIETAQRTLSKEEFAALIVDLYYQEKATNVDQ